MTIDSGSAASRAAPASTPGSAGSGTSDVPDPDARGVEPHDERPLDPASLPASICPFLATATGDWRAAFPTREHLCTAVEPPVALALEKQRRLCLVTYHETCSTYAAALSARAALGITPGAVTSGSRAVVRSRTRLASRPIARTTPILLERPRIGIGLAAAAGRSGSQAILILLLIVAFALIALSRLGGSAPAVAPAPSPSVQASPRSTTPAASPTAAPTPSPTPLPSAGSRPPASPSP
jgi:hypothetical protein